VFSILVLTNLEPLCAGLESLVFKDRKIDRSLGKAKHAAALIIVSNIASIEPMGNHPQIT